MIWNGEWTSAHGICIDFSVSLIEGHWAEKRQMSLTVSACRLNGPGTPMLPDPNAGPRMWISYCFVFLLFQHSCLVKTETHVSKASVVAEMEPSWQNIVAIQLAPEQKIHLLSPSFNCLVVFTLPSFYSSFGADLKYAWPKGIGRCVFLSACPMTTSSFLLPLSYLKLLFWHIKAPFSPWKTDNLW